MPDVISEVRALKERAMLARDAEEFADALSILEDAEQLLQRELSELEGANQENDPGRYELAMKKQLYHIRGSKGGVYRRAHEWRNAIAAYDAGYEIEREFEDSYNLTQRLVSRVLAVPEAADTAGATVEGLHVRSELANARDTIRRQMASSRETDEYAAADLLTVSLLLGDDDWRDALHRFLSRASRTSYAHEVTRGLLVELVQELSASGTGSPGLMTRLQAALAEI